MALSKLDIYNQAMSHISSGARIQAEDEQSTERETCDLHYVTVLEDALGMWDWSFAHTEAALVDVGSPPSNWEYRYTYPSNCFRPRYIVGDSRAQTDQPIPFDVMRYGGSPGPDKVIVTSRASAILAYTVRIADDEANYHLPFALTLAYGLAAKIAVPLTKSMKLQQMNEALYRQKLVEALSFDARFNSAVRSRDETLERTASSVRFE